jgi:hypothetical protein
MHEKSQGKSKASRQQRVSVRTGKPEREAKTGRFVIVKPKSQSGTLVTELARQGLFVAVPRGTSIAAIKKKLNAVEKRTMKPATSSAKPEQPSHTLQSEQRARLVGTPISRSGTAASLPWAKQEQLEAVVVMSETLSSDEIAARLDTNRETIKRWRTAGRLIGVEGAKRGVRYPAAQLGPNLAPLKGIQEVLELLDGDHWEAWRFLADEIDELDEMTGFDALRDDRLQEVLAVLEARSHGSFS